jgi:hypothetical protein
MRAVAIAAIAAFASVASWLMFVRRRLSRFFIAAIDAALRAMPHAASVFLILIFFHFFFRLITPRFLSRHFDYAVTIFSFDAAFSHFAIRFSPLPLHFQLPPITPASFSAAFDFSPSNTLMPYADIFRLLRHYAIIRRC